MKRTRFKKLLKILILKETNPTNTPMESNNLKIDGKEKLLLNITKLRKT